MPVNFDYKITLITSGEDNSRHMSDLKPLPSQCPVCKSFISPHFILVHDKMLDSSIGSPERYKGTLWLPKRRM